MEFESQPLFFLFYLQELPPYNGYGLIEDSVQNCFALIPKAPRKDIVKMLVNDNKVLRYLAALVSASVKQLQTCVICVLTDLSRVYFLNSRNCLTDFRTRCDHDTGYIVY